MKKIINKGFTLIELIIVMVLLGILAAVAVPRMTNSIRSAEESAEQKFMGNLVSALEVYASDEVVKHSVKKYPSNPFIALDKWPDGNVWQFDGMNIRHFRNGYNDGNYSMNEMQSWSYVAHDPGSGPCYTTTDNGDGTYNDQPSSHGCYEISGPGYNGYGYMY
jgi:prepilin-type N-terminal cleavage/methylation domain-containing protein